MILMCVITCTGCYHQNRLFGCSFVTPVLLMVVFMVVLVLSVVRIGVVLVQYSWLALLVVSLVVWYDMLVICWLYMSIVWWIWFALVVLGLVVDLVVLVILRIQLKLNTALLSTVRPSVCSCVTGVTSHISHIYKGIYALLIIRGPIKPYIPESKSPWLSF